MSSCFYFIFVKIQTGICLTRDLDVVLDHMNNFRFLREVDMARIDFYVRSKLYSTVRSMGGHIWLAASNIRYRRFIRLFQRFKVVTRIVYWDAEHIYIEHQFVGTGKDQFVHASMYCQHKIVHVNAEDVMQALMKEGKEVLSKPQAPEPVRFSYYFFEITSLVCLTFKKILIISRR